MRKLYILLAFTCVLMMVEPASAQRRRRITTRPIQQPAAESSEPDAWRTYTSTDGGFSIYMPGVPQKHGQVVQTASGAAPSLLINLKTATAEYAVSYTDFSTPFNDATLLKAAYDGGRDSLLASGSFKLVSERDISVSGFTGRHFTAEGNGRLLNDRLITVNQRLYQVMIITPDYRSGLPEVIKANEALINKFMDSFKLLDSSKGSTQTEPITVSNIDKGWVENSVYHNKYLAFNIALPADWQVMAQEVNEAAVKLGRELVKGDDQQLNAAVDNSAETTIPLFSLSKFPPGTPNVNPALLQCGAERLSGGKTSSSYMEDNKRVLLASPLQYKLTRDVYPQIIGGLSFSVMDMEQSFTGVTVKQKYYATIRKGYALFFVISYLKDEDGVSLEQILQGAQFQ